MKRLLSFFLIITLVASTYRDAEASPAVAVVAVAAGATLLVAAGATSYYQNSSGASSSTSSAGDVYSQAIAYTKATSAVGQALLYEQAAALKVSAAQLLDAVSKSAADAYAALKNALGITGGSVPPSTPPPSGAVATMADGSNHFLGQYLYRSNANPSCTRPGSWTSNGQVWFVLNSYRLAVNNGIMCGGGYGRIYDVAVYADGGITALPQNTNTPPLVPPVSAVPNLLGGAGSPIAPDVAKDINDLIKANPQIATPVTSGSAAGAVGGSTSVAVPYTPDLPVGSTVASTPSTPVPTQIPTQYEAVDPPDVYPSTNAVKLQNIDLSKWTKLYGVMEKTFPFSLLTTLSGYLDVLVVDPVAPSFDMHVYQDQKLHIDLSFFDPVAALVRWVIGILLTIGAILGMQKWWRGVS